MLINLTTEIIGYALDNDVFNQQGMLLLPRGHVITAGDISFLNMHRIYEVDATPPSQQHEQKVMDGSILSDTMYHIRLQKAHSYYNQSISKIKEVFQQIQSKQRLDTAEVNQQFKPLLELSLQQKNLFYTLTKREDNTDYLSKHSVHVGMIATVMASLLKIPDQRCFEIGIAGLFHDIGKVASASLDKEHPKLGYDLLKQSGEVSQETLEGVLFHHEELDGKGYPLGLTGQKVPIVAQIIAAANLFDNYCTNTEYHPEPSPYFAIVELTNAAYQGKLNSVIVTSFVQYIVPSFVGDKIILSDGRKGEIVKIDATEPHRPTVWLETGEFIDLQFERELAIQKLVRK